MSNKHISVILFIIFAICSLVLFSYIGYIERGFVQDGIFFFDQFLEYAQYGVVTNSGMRMRYFSCMVLQLPMAIAKFGLNIESREILSRIFSFSLVFLPFLTIFWNLLLSKRTKRYDIFVCSVALYVFGVLPFFYYSIVEFFISVSLYLVLLHYIISKIEYKFYDYIPMGLLCVFLFSSHEFVGLYGFILFLCSLYCFRNKELSIKTRIIKLLTGICGLASGILFWFYYFTPHGPNIQADGGLNDFTQGIHAISYQLFSQGGIYTNILVLTILLIVFFLFYKRKINIITTIPLSFIYICLVFFEFDRFSEDKSFYLKQFADVSIGCRFTGAIIFLLIFLYLIIFNFIKNENILATIQNKIQNVFIVILITGISISFIQLFFSKIYCNMTNDIWNYMQKSHTVLVNLCNCKNADEIQSTFAPEMMPLLSLHMHDEDEQIDKLLVATDYEYKLRLHCYSKDAQTIKVYAFGDNNYHYYLTDEETDFNLEYLNNYFKKRKFYCKEEN